MPRKIGRDCYRPRKFYKDLSYENSDSVIKNINQNINKYYNRFVKMYNKKKPSDKVHLLEKSYTRGRFTVRPANQHITLDKNKPRIPKRITAKRVGDSKSINYTRKNNRRSSSTGRKRPSILQKK